ncbi:hypothetical protein AXF42_Ash018106 [Apostasia shenzhenica]|uniref:Uncharacterized protein n=1 Tax=Apostasia shenzhenica TaxID=1088818 RepID=A0A2I0AF17_9ASPA|nr:hypothetical protein AXF42_Ash018106 [Apostasia shenzhenica]
MNLKRNHQKWSPKHRKLNQIKEKEAQVTRPKLHKKAIQAQHRRVGGTKVVGAFSLSFADVQEGAVAGRLEPPARATALVLVNAGASVGEERLKVISSMKITLVLDSLNRAPPKPPRRQQTTEIWLAKPKRALAGREDRRQSYFKAFSFSLTARKPTALLDKQPLNLTYHKGELLSGPTSVNLIWYGNFIVSQLVVVFDFVTSLFADNNRKQPHSVSSWWATVEKYYT